MLLQPFQSLWLKERNANCSFKHNLSWIQSKDVTLGWTLQIFIQNCIIYLIWKKFFRVFQVIVVSLSYLKLIESKRKPDFLTARWHLLWSKQRKFRHPLETFPHLFLLPRVEMMTPAGSRRRDPSSNKQLIIAFIYTPSRKKRAAAAAVMRNQTTRINRTPICHTDPACLIVLYLLILMIQKTCLWEHAA